MQIRKIIYTLCFIAITISISACFRSNKLIEKEEVIAVNLPRLLYDINIDSLEISHGWVRNGQFLSSILESYRVDYAVIDKLAKEYRHVFDTRKIKAGNAYTVMFRPGKPLIPVFLVYEINATDYAIFSLTDSINIRLGHKDVEQKIESAEGVITSSLWNAMIDQGYDPNLSGELSEIYAWTIDFFGIQKNDRFEVIYERFYVEGKPIGIGKILSARFNHYGKDYFAFRFEQNDESDYFDETGQSLMRAFLKAPLKYSRISSTFTNSRYHPILKKSRPHHGVDYAAPSGTAVFSIGEGTIIKKGFQAGGGGNYLYIRHNGTYTTAYMHLKGFAKGITNGSRVSQGQLIGYVGSTGLSTGPHLDFRVFRNNTPINPLTMESPPAKPIEKQYLEKYLFQVREQQELLEKVLKTDSTLVVIKTDSIPVQTNP
ncbi:MAG: peptidoglycan DD-metalloendopeptidase family protein [Bacteroidales bacterium]|nr:peptidoglycan DD-metalloendopeptidase family protein [Bacteroidales bacterium]